MSTDQQNTHESDGEIKAPSGASGSSERKDEAVPPLMPAPGGPLCQYIDPDEFHYRRDEIFAKQRQTYCSGGTPYFDLEVDIMRSMFKPIFLAVHGLWTEFGPRPELEGLRRIYESLGEPMVAIWGLNMPTVGLDTIIHDFPALKPGGLVADCYIHVRINNTLAAIHADAAAYTDYRDKGRDVLKMTIRSVAVIPGRMVPKMIEADEFRQMREKCRDWTMINRALNYCP